MMMMGMVVSCRVDGAERKLRSRRRIRILGLSMLYHGTQFPHGYLKSNIYTKSKIYKPPIKPTTPHPSSVPA